MSIGVEFGPGILKFFLSEAHKGFEFLIKVVIDFPRDVWPVEHVYEVYIRHDVGDKTLDHPPHVDLKSFRHAMFFFSKGSE